VYRTPEPLVYSVKDEYVELAVGTSFGLVVQVCHAMVWMVLTCRISRGPTRCKGSVTCDNPSAPRIMVVV